MYDQYDFQYRRKTVIIRENLTTGCPFYRESLNRKEVRIKGHIYVCVLACFIMTAIEYIAQKKKVNKSARKVLRELSKLGLIEIGLPNGETRFSTTTINKEQQAILKSFGIKKLRLPSVV